MGDSLNGKWCAREEEIQETERITQLPGRISNLKYPRLYVSHEVVDPLSSSIQKKKIVSREVMSIWKKSSRLCFLC